MSNNNLTHASFRKARTRTLIQLGGLVEKAGLMKNFGLESGDNLQEDLDKKENIFALLGSLLELKTMLENNEFHIDLLTQKGATAFLEDKKK